jgi:dTDP-4-amino-4,6-dideoxygalactose transaminase
MKSNCTRRDFIRTAAIGTLAVGAFAAKGPAVYAAQTSKPAVLGGAPVHTGGWPGWPSWDKNWEPELLEVLRSGHWWRGAGNHVERFEKAYAELLGAQRCLATASGTTALMVALHVMGVDAGDEVIVSPFTFIATYNAVLDLKALPVFADTDPATFTLDPTTIESRVTERTQALLPVHIYGLPCDMDPINAVAAKHRLGVVEDACQAWLAEYKGRKCGILGDLGCFSFQNSKHLPSGEGGAITGNRHELLIVVIPITIVAAHMAATKGQRPSSRAAATSECSNFRQSCCYGNSRSLNARQLCVRKTRITSRKVWNGFLE